MVSYLFKKNSILNFLTQEAAYILHVQPLLVINNISSKKQKQKYFKFYVLIT